MDAGEAREGDAAFLAALRPERPTYAIGTWLYLRALGVVHVIAFLDLDAQLAGLIGSRGLMPARALLDAHAAAGHGWRELPTLAWWGASDGELHLLAWGGALAGAVLALGWRPRWMLGLCFVFYLSLQVISGPFLGYQWDLLLLEGTVVAIALAPARRERLRGAWGVGPSRPARIAWFAHAFLFGRLMFASGVVKLASGDPDWASLRALDLHYWTQPLPNPLSLWMADLPHAVHATSVVLTLAVELAFPLLLVVRGWPRRVGALGLGALQLLIALTGNFGFFNLLCLGMALPLLDDALLGRVLGRSRAGRVRDPMPGLPRRMLAGFTIAAGLVPLAGLLLGYAWMPEPAIRAIVTVSRFGPGTDYGLFADMTDDRVELVFEGTRDGRTWEPYVLPFQPGPLDRRPGQAAPHMPRLDWSLWFAALGSPSHLEVAHQLRVALEVAEPDVLALLETDPFGGDPPRAIRLRRFRYRPAPAESRESGVFWTRSPLNGAAR